MTPVPVPCSRNAHDQSVLVRRPQWDQHGCHSKRGKASELGRPISIDDGRSMRAVGDQTRPPLEKDEEKRKERTLSVSAFLSPSPTKLLCSLAKSPRNSSRQTCRRTTKETLAVAAHPFHPQLGEG